MPRSAPPALRRRPFRALPPITRGPEAVEGIDLLNEVPGDAGVVLWQSLRNVLLWARTPQEERGAMFSPEAAVRRGEALLGPAVDEALREPLAAVAAVLARPRAARPERVARACEAVAVWAEERAAGATALAFMQAAALALPGDAGLACAVGRLARRNGETVRAEGWLHLAVVLGRGGGDWSAYARAYLGLGNLALQAGNLPRARRMHRRALMAARRHRLRAVEAQALHDLFVTAGEMGSGDEAREAARAALRAYGPEHPRLPALAADIACFWVARGEFARALPVLRLAAERFADPAERAVVLANAARAAGGAGNGEAYDAAANEALRLVEEHAAAPRAAQVWLNLARGAASLGDPDRAAAAAELAGRLARERGEQKVRASAEAILAEARADRSAAFHVAQPAAPVPADLAEAEATLADELVRCLTGAGATAG
jgi:tetratricopeptide (TPR) repeat protein